MGTRGAIGAVLGSAVLSAAIAGPASASMIVVNTTADEFKSGDGKCSLREAVAAVNSPAAPTDCNAAAFGANTIALGRQHCRCAVLDQEKRALPSPGARSAGGSLRSCPFQLRQERDGPRVIDDRPAPVIAQHLTGGRSDGLPWG